MPRGERERGRLGIIEAYSPADKEGDEEHHYEVAEQWDGDAHNVKWQRYNEVPLQREHYDDSV
jgi:hypothetical protein